MVEECSDGSDRPIFSLVFLTWNSEDDIHLTLDSVLEQTYPDYEIIVVDNDSQDQTVPIIKETYLSKEKIRLIENETNLGFTRGINRGIEAAQGNFICCYNDDTHFPKKYLQTLAETVTESEVWTTARINHRVSTEHQTVRLLTHHRFPVPYIVDSLSEVASVNYVPGDGLIVPREIYEEELNGIMFDPTMPEKGEDIDLSLRLQKRGIPMKAILDTYSIHPDEGFYSISIKNAVNHLANVYARFCAYRKNDFGIVVLLSVLASTITVPFVIFGWEFPKSTQSFKKKAQIS